MEHIVVGPDKTEVLIGRGLPNQFLPPRDGRSRVAILTQPAPTDVALQIARQLEADGLQCEVVGLPDREAAKTLEVASSIYDVLAKFGLGRHDTVLGVGGGSVTDIAGFVAGTWMRGVESVYAPTTLLGAVDASIGGKTGINVVGKNLVGVFWHPSRVIIDTAQLSRLPTVLIRDGLAEAYKAGLVGDPELARQLSVDGLDMSLDVVVPKALAVKARIVEADALELGVRAHLNFGHTIGHALEYSSTLSHGQAVALGMIAAARVSAVRFGFAGEDSIVSALEKLSLPTAVDGLNRARVVDLVGMDKKRDSEGARMVLLRDVGQPVLEHVTESEVNEGLSAIGF